jgi:hypothetical protein
MSRIKTSLVTAAERYSVLRRFSPRFLAAFDFRSNTPNDPVLAAVDLLRKMDRDGIRALPKRPPSSFLPPQWRRLIFANSAADRRLYETAVLATLRDRLRGSNIWVAGSRDYRAFEITFCPPSPRGIWELAARPIPAVTSRPGRRCCASV